MTRVLLALCTFLGAVQLVAIGALLLCAAAARLWDSWSRDRVRYRQRSRRCRYCGSPVAFGAWIDGRQTALCYLCAAAWRDRAQRVPREARG